MSFEELLFPDAEIIVGESIPVTLGVSTWYPVTVIDSDESTMRFTSGYTATMTLNNSDGANITTLTNASGASGRSVNLTPLIAGPSFVIQFNAAGAAILAPYLRRRLVFNLVMTRTSDGLPIDLMRDCFIVPQSAND